MTESSIWLPKGEQGDPGPEGPPGPPGPQGPPGEPGEASVDQGLRDILQGAGGAEYVQTPTGSVQSALDSKVAKTSNTGAALMPTGTSAERPASPSIGWTRINTTTSNLEFWDGTQWKASTATAIPSELVVIPDRFVPVATLTKFGNMTSGGGLAAIFDSSPITTGYREATSGYAGVTLTTPTPVISFDLVSGVSGFDASGSTSIVTLTVYGKTGAAPTSATDGTVLATETFTESNTQQTKTYNSSQPLTAFQHYWAVVSTPVWSLLAEMRLRLTDTIYYSPTVGASTSYLSTCNQLVPLISAGIEISQFRVPLQTTAPRKLDIDFHADVIHTGAGADASVAVGFSFWICYRSGATLSAMQAAPFTNIRSAVGGGNVSEINPQHYGNKAITTALALDAGFHEISVLGNGHTDGSSTQGILKVLAETGMGLNTLRVTVKP